MESKRMNVFKVIKKEKVIDFGKQDFLSEHFNNLSKDEAESSWNELKTDLLSSNKNYNNRYDKVKYKNKTYFVNGRMSSGCSIIQDVFGKKPDTGYKTLGYVKTKELKLENRVSKSMIIERRSLIHPLV